MKKLKELTKKQKICVAAHKLNPNNWLLVKETEFYYKIAHRTTNKVLWLCKYKMVGQSQSTMNKGGSF